MSPYSSVGGYKGIHFGWTKHVECVFCMGEEEVPAILGVVGVGDTPDGDEVGLDVSDCSLCRVLSVITW